MPSASPEPRNPFHPLLLITCLFFIVTALGYAVVPSFEARAKEMGQKPESSPIRDSLRVHGWKWLLVELGFIIFFGLGLMLLDRARLRRLQKAEKQDTMPSAKSDPSTGEKDEATSTNPEVAQKNR